MNNFAKIAIYVESYKKAERHLTHKANCLDEAVQEVIDKEEIWNSIDKLETLIEQLPLSYKGKRKIYQRIDQLWDIKNEAHGG